MVECICSLVSTKHGEVLPSQPSAAVVHYPLDLAKALDHKQWLSWHSVHLVNEPASCW